MMVEPEGDRQAREALIDAYSVLTARLHSPGLVSHLLTSRLLSPLECDCVKAKTTPADQNSELLDALRRKGDGCVVQFCEVLFSHDQSNCGQILLTALVARRVDVSKIRIPQPIPPRIHHTTASYYPQVEDLQAAFITFVRKVLDVGSKMKDLRVICIQLLSAVESTKRNVQEDINQLKSCKSCDCIIHLLPYWDCLNSGLLHSLVISLDNLRLNTLWRKYQAEVQVACRATLEEARSRLADQQLASGEILVAFQNSLTPRDATIQKILDLKEFLQEVMGLKEADFRGFANPTVTLFFTLARTRLPFLITLLVCHRAFLKLSHITVVFVVGEFIYDVIGDQEFPYPMTESSQAARKLGFPQDATFSSALQGLAGIHIHTENPASLQTKPKMLLEERSERQPTKSTQTESSQAARKLGFPQAATFTSALLGLAGIIHIHTEGPASLQTKPKMLLEERSERQPTKSTQVFQADQRANLHSMHILDSDLHHTSWSYKAVLIDRNIFTFSARAQVQVYSMDSGKWLSLPKAPQYMCGIAAVRGSLVLFGGRDSSTLKPTSAVSTWVDAEGKWSYVFPPMTEERTLPGVLVLGSRVFVLGGRMDQPRARTSSYFCEVLNLDSNQWRSCREVSAIPRERISVGLFGNLVVALPQGGGASYNSSAWAISVGAFLRSSGRSVDKNFPPSSVESSIEQSWELLPAVPTASASLLTPSSHPVVVGGLESREWGHSVHGKIYVYRSGQWCLMGELLTPRLDAAVVGLSSTAFLVCGGFAGSSSLNPNAAELVQF